MEAKRYLGAASVAKFSVQASFPKEWSKLRCSFHLRNDFDCGDQALISGLSSLLLYCLVLFVVI
jgi:hypothetical protein